MHALSSGKRSAFELLRGGHLHYAIGAAAALAMLFTVATTRSPPPTPGFMDRWNAVPPAYASPLLAKQVRTLSFVPTASTIPALPEIDGLLQVPMPPPKMQERPPPVPANIVPDRSPRLAASAKAVDFKAADFKGPDICRGKGRIITRGGKSWRCRR